MSEEVTLRDSEKRIRASAGMLMLASSDASLLSKLALVLMVLVLPSCTAISVRPVESPSPMTHVCIQNTPKVLVEDFVPVLRDGLSRHGISSEEFSGDAPPQCEFILTCTARRSWDLASYLSHAEIRIDREGLQIGYGEFHLRGKGGYSFFKYQGTKKKIDRVIDRLLATQRRDLDA